MENRFQNMDLSEKTLRALKKGNFEKPTDVQSEAIPPTLEGNDVIVQARTGSGKTLVFLVPIFEGIKGGRGIEAIVMTPTRELAQQVEREARTFAEVHDVGTVAIYGGASIEKQIRKLPKSSFVAGTPGRVIDLIKRGNLKLDNIRYFTLDEGDRMLDMGFLPDIRWIISRTPKNKQMMIFSATMPGPIIKLGKKYMEDPVILKLSQDDISAKGVDQYFIRVGKMNKMAKLSALLDNEPGKYLIFCNTKIWTQTLVNRLRKFGYKAHAMHGDMTQAARTRTMNDFKSGKIDILASTDVSARGIDVENITHVVNYDVPQYHKDYVHRIGRTGRLDKGGKAVTFVSGDELPFLEEIEEFVDRELKELDLKKDGRVKERIDYRENADIFGMVPFRFASDKEFTKWDIVQELNKYGIRDQDIGKIKLEDDGGLVEVIYSKASRVFKVKLFDNVELVEKDSREI
ncbi:MAG: DEAD/DEAH box helicase [Thermoplasmata archaeon]